MSKQAQLEALHACYCRLSGRTSRYRTFERNWYEFVESGYTMEDLTVVLNFILRENKRHEWKYSLALGKLLDDLPRFDDLLQESLAKERSRVRPKGNQDKIIEAFRKTSAPDPVGLPQSVKDVLKRLVY